MHDLETSDIYISTKSACASRKTEVAHTLAAMHVDHDIAISALRISLSHLTTKEELNTFIEALDLSLSRVKKQR